MKEIFCFQLLIVVFSISCFSQNLGIQTERRRDEISDGFFVYNITPNREFVLPDLKSVVFQILTSPDKAFSVLYIKDTVLCTTKIIFDRNLNRDFADDRPVVYNSDSLIQPFEKQVHLDSLRYMNEWYKFQYTLNKPGFLIFDDKTAASYFIMTSNPFYYFGNMTRMGYHVYILRKFSPVPANNNLKFVFIPIPDDTIPNKAKISKAQMILKIGDTMNLKNSTFVINDFDAKTDELILKKIREAKGGYYKGDILSNIDAVDIDNKMFSTAGTGKKYLLIDFWGTWCQPCVATLPKLKSLSDSSKGFLQILGIAYEKDKKILKEFVIKDKIFWPVIFDDQKNRKNFKEQFNITKFPTYILIGPNQRILFRESGIDGFDVIANYMKTKSKEE